LTSRLSQGKFLNMKTASAFILLFLALLAPFASAQVISTLPPATGGDPAGEWRADSTGYQVYVPPDLSSLNLTFSGRLRGRFAVKRDSTYTANYIVSAQASVNFLGQRTFDLTDTAQASGRYSVRGTRMVVTGLDSANSVDTLSYSVKADTLILMVPITDPRVTAFGIRLVLVLPFRRDTVSSGLSADFNGNGRVDFDDFFMFAEVFGRRRGETGFDAKFDLNADGAINFDDFFIFAERFGGSG